MKKETLLIREIGEQNLYEGSDYITRPVIRDMKLEYKGKWYITISIIKEGNHRTILVRKFQ